MTRAAILCPGRGSYTERSLRSLPDDHAWVRRAEELRAGYALPPLLELDRAPKFQPALHLAASNASPLIWLVSMLDAETARAQHEIVCVAGNSLGWYTALAVAGALSFDDGFKLVQEMSILQERYAGAGGQVLHPLIDGEWRADAKLAQSVQRALASSNGEALPSIDLGGYSVLAGTETGVAHLLKSLPRVELGSTPYPFRLMHHGPYHTPFVREVAEHARQSLSGLDFRAPRTTLIDGRGVRFTPWSTDPAELASYTLGAQIVERFSFTSSVRVALREHAPDRLVLPGPGNSLGGVCGQIAVMEGWRGVHSKSDFERVQASDEPLVISMRR